VSAQTRAASRSSRSAAGSEFEELYRASVAAITAFYARRCSEPQAVADLTSETFVQAIASFGTFDPQRGSARAWLFGIARLVYARYCGETVNGLSAASRLAAQLLLDDDEVEELAERIDAERAGRRLIARCAELTTLERAAIELVDLVGLTPKEAAGALKVSSGVLRVRLFRAPARLRRGAENGQI
jgi:RNA polymerase sigma-70 factor (ECF subfamily)